MGRAVGQLWGPRRCPGAPVRLLWPRWYQAPLHPQALHAALVHLLDKDFLPTSHGGRLKGSPHTALHHVFTHFGRGVRWVVRGQWPRCRDLIPVAALQAAADRHLAGDPRGLALVRAALQVPVNHARKFGALCEPLEEGVPSTSLHDIRYGFCYVLLAILLMATYSRLMRTGSNPIYAPAVNMLFHPVDELVADLAAEHSRGRFVHKAHLIREHAALQAACEAVKVPIPAKVCTRTQQCAGTCNSMQECARICTRMQQYARV